MRPEMNQYDKQPRLRDEFENHGQDIILKHRAGKNVVISDKLAKDYEQMVESGQIKRRVNNKLDAIMHQKELDRKILREIKQQEKEAADHQKFI